MCSNPAIQFDSRRGLDFTRLVRHDVFISHSSEDKRLAEAICHALEDHGITCWFAPRDIAAGQDWPTAIVKAIASCRLMVLVFSSRADQSTYVLDEVTLASDAQTTILPIRVENVVPSSGLKLHLASCQWLDAIATSPECHLEMICARVEGCCGSPVVLNAHCPLPRLPLLGRPVEPGSGRPWRRPGTV